MENGFVKFAASLFIGGAIGAGIVYLSTDPSNGGRGIPVLWGDDPTSQVANFKATHFAALYMKFGDGSGSPLMTARHAYFKVSDATGASDKVGCAIDYLKNYPAHPPTGDCGIVGKVREDFNGFDFGQKMRFYAFVDNTNVKINPTTPLSFTPFGPFDKPTNSERDATRAKNKSFYDAKVIQLPNSGGKLGLSVNNHRKNGSGGNLGQAETAVHSINFNLLVCKQSTAACDFTDAKAVIPLIIDPDGGNMGGGSPPPG